MKLFLQMESPREEEIECWDWHRLIHQKVNGERLVGVWETGSSDQLR